MIPYGRQDITRDDIDAVIAVLQSDYLTQGPTVPRFERAVAEHVGVSHAVAVNSATSALHIACLALGLGPGDWLWTTPVTFVASANCGLYCGAQVDFTDIDPRTYNLCPQALEAKLIASEKVGKLPKVVVAVHLCGQPCDMAAIQALIPSGRRGGPPGVSNISQQKPHADVVHGVPGQHLLGQRHGSFAVSLVHQAQQGAMRQAQEGAVVHFTPGDQSGVALRNVRVRSAKGPFIHLGGFVLQTQRPQPVGDEVLDFKVVRGGGFQLARLH